MGKGHKPGGGIASRVNVSPGYKTGQPAHRKRHEGVSQIGSAMGNHITEHSKSLPRGGIVERVEGGIMRGVGSQPLGNELAQATKCGPGGSRTIYAQGTQQSGAVRSMGSTRDTLSEFGPDSPNVAGRK